MGNGYQCVGIVGGDVGLCCVVFDVVECDVY